MKYHVFHTTTYHYSEPASLGHNETRLMPRDSRRQRTIAHRLYILPLPATTAEWTDYFGNSVTYFTVEEPHSELAVSARKRGRSVGAGRSAAFFDSGLGASCRGPLAAGQDADSFDALQFVLASTLHQGPGSTG